MNLAMTELHAEPAGVPELLSQYRDHVNTLDMNSSCRSARLKGARTLLVRHLELGAWMRRPTSARLADLHRAQAWPFVIWCFVAGHLRPDVEILLSKPGGVELASVWQAAHPGEVEAVAEVGRRFAWSENWIRQVSRQSLPVVCLWAGKSLGELTEADLSGFAAAAEASVQLSPSARYHARTRLHSIRRACYELGVIDTPPRQSGPVAMSAVEMAGLIIQSEIAADVARYAQLIGTTLKSSTVGGRVKAIRVFTDYLAEHHPQVTRLEQLSRTAHMEGFIVWDRTRARRGPNGGGRTISLRQFHHDLVDLRAFFEDIAAWDWARQPSRRLLFISDLPRLPDPLPRALAPDVDRDLMAAVANLQDPFTRTGLSVLRATGMRVGELLDLELDCLVDFGSHGTWLRVPLGKLNTERMVPLDAGPLAILDAWMKARGAQRALPHPRDGHMADFVFVRGGRRLTSWLLARGLDQAATAAGLRGPNDELFMSPSISYATASVPAWSMPASDCPPDGAHGTRHPRDDAALCQAVLTDAALRLRERHDQDQRTTANLCHPARRHLGAEPGRLAARRDAQDQSRSRILLERPACGPLSLCQHLRAVRQLHHHARVRSRLGGPAR
jgi:site-specific recombinase XerD